MDENLSIVDEESQWFYTTVSAVGDKQQSGEKGPVPQIVLTRLLELGVIGGASQNSSNVTMVWKNGMESWKPIHTVCEFYLH
jgi:hypothetical protein